jgi:FlaA1/EpsC-like NDP-sugar epimerase
MRNLSQSATNRRTPIDLALQLAAVFLSCGLAFIVVDGPASGSHITAILLMTAIFLVAQLGFGVIRSVTERGVDFRRVTKIVIAAIAGGLIAALLIPILPVDIGLELGPIVAAALMVALFTIIYYFALAEFKRSRGDGRQDAQPTIIVGSGKAAAALIELIQDNEFFRYSVVGCVDDEILAPHVAGKPVLGAIDALPGFISKYKIGCIIIAIPSAPKHLVKRVMSVSVRSVGRGGKPPAVKILPGVLELLKDGVKSSRVRPVQPEDLLPRDPVRVELSEIAPHVANRVILVTGAGGSIGSELCRQIVTLNPSLLLLLGHGENSLFDIDEELKLKYRFKRTKVILADVADAARIRSVFSEYRPHVVFHSAAHKHVPIVESNVCEAVRNNILGTHVVALAAAAAGTAKFVLLSTDKAVNPSSVMGATKRVSELISQSFENQTGTEFVTVRFGNVMESRGSVIPIFKKQIENGGPVTITHRDMQRYFMTIPEAASLVMMAMAIGRDGQVLVLDMGKPVKILRLAETLITLSGLTPHRDIEIVEIGIRPGEKLFEEILTTYEGLSTTSHSRLFVAQQERLAYETLAHGLARLEAGVRTGDQLAVLGELQKLVPSFQPGPHLLFDAIKDEDKLESIPEAATSSDVAAAERNGQTAIEQIAVAEPSNGRIKDDSQTAGVVSS